MPPNMRIHPTGFASLRSARLRVMREPLGAAAIPEDQCTDSTLSGVADG